MKIAILIQARTTSTRLPGKMLKRARGRVLLDHVIARLEATGPDLPIVVVTSVEPSDDPIADHCAQRGTAVERGSLHDVARRYLDAVDRLRLDAFVRITGDSAMIDGRLVAEAVDRFRGGGVDIVTNTFPCRTFPVGQSVELVAAPALKAAYPDLVGDEREHLLKGFYARPEPWRIASFHADPPMTHCHLAVDTPADFAAFEVCLSVLPEPVDRQPWRLVAEHWPRAQWSDRGTGITPDPP